MRQLLPGTEVNARGLRWEIVSVQPLGDQMLYRLRGLEHAILGKELDLLSPFEPILPLITEIQPEKATTLRNWLVYHQAFLLEQSLGGSAFTAVQPGRLKLEDYQLVPVLRALNMSRARLLLCDDVGLGKTIQAALVITELVARRMAHRILIVSPAGPLLEQWKCELWERFGLRVEIIDRAKLEEVRRENELGANPFDHIPLGLVSIDFLKQEKILGQLERSSYDVIVVDEAAHVNDTGNTQDREASQRRKLAEVLARKSDALLLLTATPHDGYDRSFASLLELLDPSLVDARGVIRPERYKPHVIRRLKEHIRDRQSGDLKFKLRQVFPVAVVSTDIDNPKFVELQKALIDLIAPELRRAFRRRDYSNVLAFIALLKRSVSTARACQNTLKVIADRFGGIEKTGVEDLESRKQRLKTLRDYHREIQRFGTTSVEQEEELAQLEAEDIAQQLASLQKEVSSGTYRLKRNASVTGALRELIVLAEQSQAQDPKIHGVIEKIREIRTECPAANVLVYTEYADSQAALVDALKKEMGIGGVLAISGQDSDKDRARITDIFRTSDNQILVSTDATSEGLNLHQRCHYLLHLELPFNPNRLEQRNGRIDRYGQGFNPIIYYFYLQGTFEEKILLRLIAKYEKQRSKLHFLPNTLGLATNADASYERLLRGLLDEDSNLFKPEAHSFDFYNPDDAEEDNIATKELLEEIDRSLKGFEQAAKSNPWLFQQGMNAEQPITDEAEAARSKGSRSGITDLVRFVLDAILLDGGDVHDGEIIEVKLPPAWSYGLDDLPGYDAESRTILLTRDTDITRDAKSRSVGYLGMAHPLVRRALDRVRNISFGGQEERGQDRRASAVAGDVSAPELILTYLGRVSSQAGREYEQVIAVKIDKAGNCTPYLSPDEWVRLADPQKAIRITDVWKDYFVTWGDQARVAGAEMAQSAFASIASDFINERRLQLQAEERQHQEWLKSTADDIIGEHPQVQQADLFDARPLLRASTPEWFTLTDPEQRLVAFKNSRLNLSLQAARAETALQVYNRRMSDLRARMNLSEPTVQPLGILMVVPTQEVRRGA